MSTDKIIGLYWKLPLWIQEMGLSAYAIHLDHVYYGEEFSRCNEIFKTWIYRSAQEIANWQSARVVEIVRAAATHVPFYRKHWKGYHWESIQGCKDIGLLPLLGKQDLRLHEHEFIDDRLKRRSLYTDKTSGSTGTSLTIYWTKRDYQRFWAMFEVSIRNAAGVSRFEPRAMLGGRAIIPGSTTKPPFWRYNRHWRQLYLSSYHVSDKTAPAYIKAITESSVTWLTGYGSAIAALSEGAMKAGVPPPKLKVIVVSGDTLQVGMRRSIEEYFGCPCRDSYGQVEEVSMAMECKFGKLHVVPEVGFSEILRPDGSPCEIGEVGEIVATGIVNEAMPLIRYRTGDRAAWSGETTCSCGRNQRIMQSLEGRTDDYLLTADGRKIGRLSTALKRSPSIHSAQIVQDTPGHAFLLVRGGISYRHDDALTIREDIIERIGDFRIEIREVSEIPKSPSGKTALVVRLTDRPEFRRLYDPILVANP
jgi:phenylacetate-CoA ligase